MGIKKSKEEIKKECTRIVVISLIILFVLAFILRIAMDDYFSKDEPETPTNKEVVEAFSETIQEISDILAVIEDKSEPNEEPSND